jgi:uncharacterized repeat protein (TIGR01451 family)
MNSEQMSTLLAGYTSLAIDAYQQNIEVSTNDSSLFITEILIGNKENTLPSDTLNYQHRVVGSDVLKVQFNNPKQRRYYYQLMQSGFTHDFIKKPLKQGIEIYRAYQNQGGQVVNQAALGDELEVHIKIRSLDNNTLSNIAIDDLLPGGFEVVRDSVKAEPFNYVDAREDRVNFFGTIGPSITELVYIIKATNPGTYTVPPIYAASMYDLTQQAHGVSSKMTVTQR